MPSIPSLLLALIILLSTILTTLVTTPPNPNPTAGTSTKTKTQPKDRVSLFTSPLFLFLRRGTIILLCLYHALLSLSYPSLSSLVCPTPENLNPALFTWSWTTSLCLGGILLASPIRLLAFNQLGPNFTFQLAPPASGKLVTTGMYRYVQHPSYTTNIIIIFANFWLFERVDGAVGCWLSKEVVNWGGWKGVGLAYVAVGVEMLRRRIVDEEGMLRGVFGREWEVWHGRTKRFVPGVF